MGADTAIGLLIVACLWGAIATGWAIMWYYDAKDATRDTTRIIAQNTRLAELVDRIQEQIDEFDTWKEAVSYTHLTLPTN